MNNSALPGKIVTHHGYGEALAHTISFAFFKRFGPHRIASFGFVLFLFFLAPCPSQKLHGAEIPFDLEDRIILLKGFINGNGPQNLILDTGASETIITPPTAKKLGIRGIATTADQSIAKVDSISVGDAMVKNLPTYIFDPPQAISLRLDKGIDYHGILGYSFLSQFVTTIDYQKKTIELSSHQDFRSPKSSANILFDLVDHHIYIKGSIDGKTPVVLLFDTGAAETILCRQTAKQLNIQGSPMAHPPDALTATLGSLTVGQAMLKDLQIVIYDPPQAPVSGIRYDGILGYNFLSQFRITIDYQNRLLALTRE